MQRLANTWPELSSINQLHCFILFGMLFSHLAPDPNAVSSMKTKRSLNNSDRRTLLYNYYARGLAPMYDKRNFDEIDRYSTFGGKRNYDFMDLNDHQNAVKRNFDEIDRYAGKSNFASFNESQVAIG